MNRKPIKPNALKSGDTVAVVASAAAIERAHLERGVNVLASLGYRVKVSERVLAGQLVAGVAGGAIGLGPTIAIGAAGLWVTAALLGFSEVGSLTGMEEHAAPSIAD